MARTDFIKTLYLQKPLLLIVLIATIATLPWIGLGDFYTKGEPREAVLAISMIDKGEWIIPTNYADEFAYKPPLNHWLIAISSIVLNGGEVTPFTSRLPSTLGFIGLVAVCFMFFARRRPLLESFVACLLIITCFELHRAAMTTRVDMLLTFFMVAGIIQLFTWYERKRFTQLLSAWILLSLGTLVKGPVAILLPCIIFGVYLLTQRVNLVKTILKCSFVALPALILPAIWYYSAYQIQGTDFLLKAFGENIGRFLSIDTSTLGIDYNLGVENPWYYYPITLLTGLLPWTLLLLISLFFLKYTKFTFSFRKTWEKLKSDNCGMADKISLYSLLTIVLSLLFFTIPSSKRSVYIMLVYPFLSLFIARYFIYLVEAKPRAVRISTWILTVISSLALLIVALSVTGVLDIENIALGLVKRERTIHDIGVFSSILQYPSLLGLFSIVILLGVTACSVYLLRKNGNVKILMVGFSLMFSINLFMDACLLPAFKNSYSSRPYAEMIIDKYKLDSTNVYVTNDLLRYPNMYGLNFYMGGTFQNIAKSEPEHGYFIGLDINNIEDQFSHLYIFELLESSDKFNDFKMPMNLYRITKKNSIQLNGK